VFLLSVIIRKASSDRNRQCIVQCNKLLCGTLPTEHSARSCSRLYAAVDHRAGRWHYRFTEQNETNSGRKNE